MKHLKTSREADVSEADIREEADIMSKLDHPHVIHTHDAFWGFRGSDGGGGGSGTSSSSSSSSGSSRKGIWIVEELCEGGPIFRWLKERSSDVRASEALHRRLTAELLAGLSYLHTHGILHRDIKPQNLLMATKADSSPPENRRLRPLPTTAGWRPAGRTYGCPGEHRRSRPASPSGRGTTGRRRR